MKFTSVNVKIPTCTFDTFFPFILEISAETEFPPEDLLSNLINSPTL